MISLDSAPFRDNESNINISRQYANICPKGVHAAIITASPLQISKEFHKWFKSYMLPPLKNTSK